MLWTANILKHKGKIMLQTILILIAGFFGIFFIILTEVEMKLRNKKELFRANLVQKWMYISGFISLFTMFLGIILA